MSIQYSFKHYLVTRFNLYREKSHRATIPKGLQADWLKKRIELFQKYCLPSVLNQTTENFSWIILCAHDTPPKYKNKIEEILREHVFIDYYFVDVNIMPSVYLSQLLLKKTSPSINYIITTWFDNDDLIHNHFIAEIQAKFKPIQNYILYFRDGYQLSLLDNNQCDIRLKSNHFNPFLSLIEHRSKLGTVYQKAHNDWKTGKNVHVIKHKRFWIELVHGDNISNRRLTFLYKTAHLDTTAFGLVDPIECDYKNVSSLLIINCIVVLRKLKMKIFQFINKSLN